MEQAGVVALGNFVIRVGGATAGLLDRVDSRTVAMMLFGIVMPAGIIWHMTDGGFDVTRHARQSWRLFTSAVANNADNPYSQHCEP